MSDFARTYEAELYKGECPFEPGDVVEHSGIYAICHTDGARHTTVLLRGYLFPDCACCGAQVRFRLLHGAPYIFDDEDFAVSS